MRCVNGRRLTTGSSGFTLFEMVVVICAIVILYMVAEQRLNELPAAAERASFFAVQDQLKVAVNFEMYTRLAKGGPEAVRSLEGTNPMALLLEAPNNYRGELDVVTDRNVTQRNSWYFETSTGQLVYVVGGASIEDVWVTIGNVDVNYGQIRMRLENVYRQDSAGENQPGSSWNGAGRDGWEAVLLRPVWPFRWEQRGETPIEI